MKTMKFALILAASATALLAGCADMGSGGFGAQGGCRTVYVFHPGSGAVQPVSSCGNLPRDRLDAKAMAQAPLLQSLAPEGQGAAPIQISAAAEATRPPFPPAQPYGNVNDMLANADMAAFITRVKEDYAAKRNVGAWGFAIVDNLARDDVAGARTVLDAMEGKVAGEMLSVDHMRPWVMAFEGKGPEAQQTMSRMNLLLPGATLLGHRALLAEGLGDTDGALAIYEQAPDAFNPPKPEEAATPGFLARAIAFNGQRLLALRQAELLRGLKRDDEAVALLTRLAAATPDDTYVKSRLDKARSGEDRRKVRNLKQALAMAISDESDLVEERQAIMGMMIGRGGKIPFNPLLASLRQSALLLDPDNGDVRLQEVVALYQAGNFEGALRIAQIGTPPPAQQSGIFSTAGLAALELGSPEAMQAMTDKALRADNSPEAKLGAAGALTDAGFTERAIRLVDQALREGLDEDRKPIALLTKGQAHFQAGDIAGAVKAAREARALKDDESTQQFLASMLVKSPQRPEGLEIMREMMQEQPNNSGLMNNFGYALIDGHASEAELEEGFKLLKEASRMTPDEPNLLDSIGWAYYQYGDFREARRYLALALEAYAPFDHWELLDHMGDIHWRLGEQEDARVRWRESVAARPPAHEIARINGKLQSGLTDPAPSPRDPPDVPRTRGRGERNDI